MVNSLDYHPCLSILASKILPFYISVNYLWLYLSLQNYCWIFSQTSLFHHVWEKYSNLWSSHSWKMHRFEAFLPTQNSLPGSCCHPLGRRTLLNLPGSILSRICFPQQQKGVEETMICFIKIQSENMKITWHFRFLLSCMICSFFQMWWFYSFVSNSII